MSAPLSHPRVVVASAIFSAVGILAIILILWSARSRSAASSNKAGDIGAREETVSFEAGGNKLAGTLFVPKTRGPHPAVAFVHGAGAVDRRGYPAGKIVNFSEAELWGRRIAHRRGEFIHKS